MASLSDAEECLKEEETTPGEEAAKKPAKKKKKKKKKSTATELESEVSPTGESASSSNIDEKTPIDCSIIAKEKTDIYPETLVEETPSKSEEASKSGAKDEAKPRGSCEVTNTKQQGSVSTQSKSKKKKKNNKETTSAVEKVAEEKEKRPEIIPEEAKDKENDINREKPSDSAEVTGSFEVVRTIHPKESDENKSSSPATKRKKKKKKKKTGFLLSDALTEPQNDSDKEKNDAKAVQVSKKNDKHSPMEEQTSTDLEEFTKETSLLQLETREKNNFLRICILTYGLVLDTLRKLFLDIHPTWTNKPDDARNLDKGKMKLHSHEQALFDTGDIKKWDVSLITTVLLYSKKCAKELKLMPGYEDAIRTIKDQKNRLISHRSSKRMPDDEFNMTWDEITKALETLGASRENIDDAQSDDALESGKFYRDLFLQEMANKDAMLHNINAKIENMGDEVADKVVQRLTGMTKAKREIPAPSLQDLSGPKWDEWLRFCDNVHDFDHEKNSYVLITDRMSSENVENFSVLRSVAWKMVLDFDPSSEEHGMYHAFLKKDGQNSLIDMITPDEIRRDHSSTVSLARHIDSRKTQWLFVNGREKDNQANNSSQHLHDWKTSSLKHVSRFLSCCSDPEKIDKHKPLICLILPFREEAVPFLKVTLERFVENFDEFSLQFVGVKHENSHDLGFEVRLTELPTALLAVGLRNLLQDNTDNEYRLPTFQAKLPAKLTNHQYLYLQEYLDVMYDGCEDLPKVNCEEDEEKLNKILNEHKESFLSGNWISFVSLYDNHDAKRELGDEIRSHIHRLLEQGPTHSTILEIRHAPGTGGTTIARRVLWDLHKTYPCAIAKLEDYKFDFDDDFLFINALADRISAVQDICGIIPLILLDGNHSRIEPLSNTLVRVLNSRGQRVVLLSCMHRLSKASDSEANSESSDIHAQFQVNVKLEESVADRRQFEEKYKDFIDNFKSADQWSPKRVFHFPLLAMLKGLEGFRTKLEQIVFESFDGMDGLRKAIAAVVAYIQLYASQATPASFLNKAFHQHVSQDVAQKGTTYKDINQLVTDQLLSLMVPAKPSNNRRGKAFGASESYTLQHPLVAEMVLQRYEETFKCDIFELTRHFLKLPIFQDGEFFSLVNALFIRNRSSLPKARFSILFEKLNSLNPLDAAQIFRDLAEKTSDAIFFAHAARFHAKNSPPLFQHAKELIAKAFSCKNAQTKKRIIYDFKGHILQSELRNLVDKGKIDCIARLEDLANEAVQSYLKSRNYPLTYPWPLMGEVKVWISCIEWIIKNKCNGDTDKAIAYITSEAPPFYHTCIGDSFHLLDVVDDIVQKEENLAEPEEIQKQCNNLKMSLLKTVNKRLERRSLHRRVSGRSSDKEQDIVRACKALCSKEKFPKSSPVELKRLQVHYVLNSIDQVEVTTTENIKFLLDLLIELVFTDKQVGMARHLLKVCLFSPEDFPLDKGMRVADIWIKEAGHDPLPYFYKMMIAFLMILNGNPVFYRDIYQKALEMCKERSQNHCRRLVSTHFLKNTGDGMNRLMTKAALLSGEKDYPQNLEDFWTTVCRRKLKECKGRIRLRSKTGKRKQVYIELLEGNVEIYVGKNADIGKVERDFTQGTIVHFVVSFNLEGPVANGITFKPTSQAVS